MNFIDVINIIIIFCYTMLKLCKKYPVFLARVITTSIFDSENRYFRAIYANIVL